MSDSTPATTAGLPPYDHDAAMRLLDAINDPDWEAKRVSESAATSSTTSESPFDSAWYEASRLTLGTLVPGVEYTLVRHNDSSDHGRSECFFADQNDAERYVTRLKAASASGSLDEHFHPWPATFDLALLVFTVTRRA